MGVECIYNHADYRLISNRVLQALAEFEEVNIFLRGMIPLIGYKNTCVYYKRAERLAGQSHYSLKKCLLLQFCQVSRIQHRVFIKYIDCRVLAIFFDR